MTWDTAAIVLLGALAGGFVNGLTGFGTGLTAIGIWLHVLPPATTATLVIMMSVAAQIQNLPLIWRSIDWRKTTRFVIPGILAVPLGALALKFVDARQFKLGVGLFLVIYAGIALASSLPPFVRGGRPADMAVGAVSGLLGGLAGLSGALMVVWTDMRGDSKEHRRSLLQSFNLLILSAALLGHTATGQLTVATGYAFAAALPGTFIGAFVGARAYTHLADRNYRRVVLLLLLVSGVGLVVAGR